MSKEDELIEIENRYCPICGVKVNAGSKLHRCSKKKLKELEIKDALIDKRNNLEKDRTYDDRLREFEEYFDYNDEG